MKLFYSNWMASGYVVLLLILALVPLGMSATLNNTYTLQVRADYLVHALFYIPLPVILLSMLVVVLFEAVQMLIPYRTFNINDMIANGVGVVIGLLIFIIFRKNLFHLFAS